MNSNFYWKKPKWLAGLLVLGVILVLFGSFSGTGKSPPAGKAPPASNPAAGQASDNDPATMLQYEHLYDQELAKVLNEVPGVSDVSVIVNIDATAEEVFAENTTRSSQTTKETDKQGGTRVTTQINDSGQLVMVKNGDGESPVVIRQIKPHVRGVLVVARGAEDIRVQAMIMSAIESLLDVPANKIAILPRKG
jgi:stage III sporulation protein AG